MIARVAFGTLLAAALSWPLLARSDDFKIPPTPDHYVTDNAGALSSAAREKIESELQRYEKATGHQIIVWIAPTTGGVPLETWTGEAADHWKVGRRGKDDGAVLFLFTQDHRVRIEVGYGLESVLTDADTHRIISDDVVPRMKAGDVDGAVSSAVAAMLTTATPSYAGVTPPPAPASNPAGDKIATFIAVIVVLWILFFAFMVVMQIVRAIRYGYLIMREGSTAARRDMRSWPAWAGGFLAGSTFSGGSSFGGGGDFGGGFSAGGGGFGGGGASGSW